MGWPVHFPAHHVMPEHSFWLGVHCEDTLLDPSQVCQTQMIFDIDGDTISVDFMVDFLDRGVDQRIFGPSTTSPLVKPK